MPVLNKKGEYLRETLIILVLFSAFFALTFFSVSRLSGFAVMQENKVIKYAFCEDAEIEINQLENYKTISCSRWVDAAPVLDKLDMNYLILKRGNALVFSPY